MQKSFSPLDLFPAVNKELEQQKRQQKKLVDAYKKDPSAHPKPPQKQFTARNPTRKESDLSLQIVKKSFIYISSNYNKIYDKHDSKLVALVEFLKFEDLTEEQWDDLNFLSVLLHKSKEFISPVGSKT